MSFTPDMLALDRFVQWMASYEFIDRNKKLPVGLRLSYHSRSDAHSKALGRLIVADLLEGCDVIREQALAGQIAFSINCLHLWPNGKQKTIDLAVGIPRVELAPPIDKPIHEVNGSTWADGAKIGPFAELLVACEEKAVMTEHIKSEPRIYSELNDSHTIVHQGYRAAIAAGITMVNIADTFISPLRQRRNESVEITLHDQPDAATSMVRHLRKLPVRDSVDKVGLDAYATFVVDVNNQGRVGLHSGPPAPQPGDPDFYGAFLESICRAYTERFSDLHNLPSPEGVTIQDAFTVLARKYPNLLIEVAQWAVSQKLDGADELLALVRSAIGKAV